MGLDNSGKNRMRGVIEDQDHGCPRSTSSSEKSETNGLSAVPALVDVSSLR